MRPPSSPAARRRLALRLPIGLLALACRSGAAPPLVVPVDVPTGQIAGHYEVPIVVRVEDVDSRHLQPAEVTGTLEPLGLTEVDGLVSFTVLPPYGWHHVRIEARDRDGGVGAIVVTFEAVNGDVDEDTFVSAALRGDDCDDGDPAVHPGADERCDGVDEDCDGAVDDAPADGPLWFPDDDGDGFGATVGAVTACEAPPTAVAGAGDCDDRDPLVHVGATRIGRPGCEGFGAATVWVGEQGGDRAGEALAGADELWVGAPADGASGAVYALPSVPPGRASLGDALGAWRGEEPGDDLGAALADADGRAVVAAPGAGGGDGAVYVLAASPTADAVAADVALATLRGDPGSGLGRASAGDVDGDGAAELFLGAPLGGAGAGWVAVVPGSVSGEHGVADVEAARLTGDAAVGAAEPEYAGDLDGDGLAELLVGAPGDATSGDGAGAVAVVRSPVPAGAIAYADADRWLGAPGAAVGRALAATDLDGDGLADVIVGAPREEFGAGAVLVVLGPGPTGLVDLEAAADARRTGAGDQGVGEAVAAGGDVDGDGAPDLAIGAPGDDAGGDGAGAVYVAWGPWSAGSGPLADVGFVLTGEASGDRLGAAVGLADADGDGFTDVIAGAPGRAELGPDAGAAYVVYGGALTLD